MRRKARGERPAVTLHQQLAGCTDSSDDGQEKEGQRPAPGHCSSSGGSVLNQRVETRKLVRLQLACPKLSAHLPTSISSSCNTDSACEPASPEQNPSEIRLGPQAGVRGHGLQPHPWSGLGGVQPAVPMGSRWGWRWSCWCCFSSGCSAPRWEPAGPSPLKNCHSTPAESTSTTLNQHTNPFPPCLFSLFHVGNTNNGVWGSSQSGAFAHHEGWNNRLLELCFEGVHQLFGFGVVEGQNTCRKGRGRP